MTEEYQDNLYRKIRECEDEIGLLKFEISGLEDRIEQQQEVYRRYQQICMDLEDAKSYKRNQVQQMYVYMPHVKCVTGYEKQIEELLEGMAGYQNREQLEYLKNKMAEAISRNQQKVQALQEQVSICYGQIGEYNGRLEEV